MEEERKREEIKKGERVRRDHVKYYTDLYVAKGVPSVQTGALRVHFESCDCM